MAESPAPISQLPALVVGFVLLAAVLAGPATIFGLAAWLALAVLSR